ncbi:MAG: amidohydrolase family protein [Terriglobales bacterium]
MRLIDTHQHLWDLDRLPYSWCAGNPVLNRSFRMADYLAAVAGLGVEKSVHVEADVDVAYQLDETRALLALAEEANPLAGVVACARPESPDFAAALAQISGHPKLKGLRRILHTEPDAVGQGELFRRHVASLAGTGLTFDLCVLERQLPIAHSLVRATSGVQFILDHCGVPLVRERVLDPWREHIQSMAALPNVVCKISGLVAYADLEGWTADDLRPYVEHVIECFGWDRVLFGSDWPVCTLAASFGQWLAALQSIVQDRSAAERQKLFYENALRVYRL